MRGVCSLPCVGVQAGVGRVGDVSRPEVGRDDAPSRHPVAVEPARPKAVASAALARQQSAAAAASRSPLGLRLDSRVGPMGQPRASGRSSAAMGGGVGCSERAAASPGTTQWTVGISVGVSVGVSVGISKGICHAATRLEDGDGRLALGRGRATDHHAVGRELVGDRTACGCHESVL